MRIRIREQLAAKDHKENKGETGGILTRFTGLGKGRKAEPNFQI
jgi:hypothetical protein